MKVRATLDTNVLVAAARSRQGASFALLQALGKGQFEIALSVALYTEWQAVLTRPENLPPGLEGKDALAFLRYLASIAHLQEVFYLWRPCLKDPDDDMVLECAVASGSKYLVTHNLKDFRSISSFGIQAISPKDFLQRLKESA